MCAGPVAWLNLEMRWGEPPEAGTENVTLVDACEQRACDAVTRKLDQEETMATMTSARADVHSAQLTFGRARSPACNP